MIIGVDFDNTIVRYDEVMRREARSRGWIDPSTVPSKRAIRDQIRRLPDGELEWQRLQAVVYGPKINEASVAEGVEAFFRACRDHHIPAVIISHKTRYASVDRSRTDLRVAALAWMRRHRVFDRDGFGLSSADVQFASTRQEKMAWIIRRGCTVFIDDLEETFVEPAFPSDVEKILYAPSGPASTVPTVKTATSWQEIGDVLFAAVRS